MSIQELFESAIEEDDTDLQALVMFLVFEKEVLTMNDDIKELDLYFLPKHEQRMGAELTEYKHKMSMKHPASAYRVYTKEKETMYIKAENDWQAASFVSSMGFTHIKVEYVPKSELMYYENENQNIAEIIKKMPTPSFIGSNTSEQKYGGM